MQTASFPANDNYHCGYAPFSAASSPSGIARSPEHKMVHEEVAGSESKKGAPPECGICGGITS